MADPGYRSPGPAPAGQPATGTVLNRQGTPWGAIWAGVFSFAAIWTVFGMLGLEIFRSAGMTNVGPGGVGWGMGIWGIVLTAIAMFIGGRVTARLADAGSAREAVFSAQSMFGLAVVGVLVYLALMGTGVGMAEPQVVAHSIRDVGWFGWIGVLVGWLSAMGGAMAAQRARRQGVGAPVRDIRSAA